MWNIQVSLKEGDEGKVGIVKKKKIKGSQIRVQVDELTSIRRGRPTYGKVREREKDKDVKIMEGKKRWWIVEKTIRSNEWVSNSGLMSMVEGPTKGNGWGRSKRVGVQWVELWWHIEAAVLEGVLKDLGWLSLACAITISGPSPKKRSMKKEASS